MTLRAALAISLAICWIGCSNEKPAEQTFDAREAPFAIVTKIEGELWQGQRQLKEGDSIDFDADIEVRQGRAVISLSGMGSVRLYPKTKLQVRAKKDIKLLLGRIWAIIQPQATERFVVETPNAVAGVRGTQFGVELREDGATRVAVSEGKVAVHNAAAPSQQVTVEPNQQTEVRGQEPPTPPAAVDAVAEQRAWEAPAPQGAPEDAPPAAPVGPTPGARPDRKAFEKLEKQGREQKEKLEKEAAATKEELKKEEEAEKKKFEKPREEHEKDLEADMGMPGKGKGKAKNSLKGKSIRKDDDEMKDFLE